MRPTADRVRSAVFSIIGSAAVEGAAVLDLYAGTGVLGFESLSRGASRVDFVEAHTVRSRRIRENLRAFGLEEGNRVHVGKVEVILARLQGPYNLVFADPPYEMDVWDGLLTSLGDGNLIIEHGLVVAEHRFTKTLARVYGKLVHLTNRRYGDTSVSIYRAGEMDG